MHRSPQRLVCSISRRDLCPPVRPEPLAPALFIDRSTSNSLFCDANRFSDLRKRMRRTLVVGLAIAAWHLATIAASAQQTLTSIVATPSSGVPVGVATPVLVTVVINGDGVIPESVVLQRIDAAGRVLATLGPSVDNGTNGDVTAGDRTFTARPTLYELAPGTVRLRVSAAFLGKIARVVSAPVIVTVQGVAATVAITEPANLAYLNVSPIQVRGTVGDPQASVVIN